MIYIFTLDSLYKESEYKMTVNITLGKWWIWCMLNKYSMGFCRCPYGQYCTDFYSNIMMNLSCALRNQIISVKSTFENGSCFKTNNYCASHVPVQTNFARSSSNSLRLFQRFRQTLVPNFIQIRQRVKNFPIYPPCKNFPLSATL